MTRFCKWISYLPIAKVEVTIFKTLQLLSSVRNNVIGQIEFVFCAWGIFSQIWGFVKLPNYKAAFFPTSNVQKWNSTKRADGAGRHPYGMWDNLVIFWRPTSRVRCTFLSLIMKCKTERFTLPLPYLHENILANNEGNLMAMRILYCSNLKLRVSLCGFQRRQQFTNRLTTVMYFEVVGVSEIVMLFWAHRTSCPA